MEIKRLPWVIALVFSVVLMVHYFELPYGYDLSYLFSFTKSEGVSIDPEGFANPMSFSALNSTKMNDGHENLTITEFSDDSSDTFGVIEDPSSDISKISNNNSADERVVKNKSLIPGKNMESNYSSTSNSSFGTLRVRSDLPTLKKNEERMGKNGTNVILDKEKPGFILTNISTRANGSSVNETPTKKRGFKGPPSVVVPISEMNSMLLQSRISYKYKKPRWPSEVDQVLLNAKALIEKAEIIKNDTYLDVNAYRNYSAFVRSYEQMERTLKIYIYAEGEKPIFHQQELDGIYASEGWFMKQLEENKHFVTKNATKAHLFYLPFSSRLLQETLYVPNSHSRKNLVKFLSSYLDIITTKYRFWNRTGGADHFLVACHDWAPSETSRIMKNCIRALCNADIKVGFQFGKDVSLPETYIRFPKTPLKDLGGKPVSKRHILCFFAGKMHGYLRPILLHHWENKDPDMKIFGKLRPVKGHMTYSQYMKSSKYCISAKGYEAYTPRVIEAIFHECVPVVISDNFVPPFFETLNWESFAVFILEKDIPNLKNILLSIPEKRYLEMQRRVKNVQKHFLWNPKPVKYDIFHMILHSIWYTRVFQMRLG